MSEIRLKKRIQQFLADHEHSRSMDLRVPDRVVIVRSAWSPATGHAEISAKACPRNQKGCLDESYGIVNSDLRDAKHLCDVCKDDAAHPGARERLLIRGHCSGLITGS